MTFARHTILILLATLILAVSHPYVFYVVLAPPFSVLLIIDKEDQDEDIVIVFKKGSADQNQVANYKEESKRDFGRKGVKFKLKAVNLYADIESGHILFSTNMQFTSLPEYILEAVSRHIFHPPPAIS